MRPLFLSCICLLCFELCFSEEKHPRICPSLTMEDRVSQQEDLRMQAILIEQGLAAADLEMKKNKVEIVGLYSTQTLYLRAKLGDLRLRNRMKHMQQTYVTMLVRLAYGEPVENVFWGTKLEDMPPIVKEFWVKQIAKFYNEGIVETMD